MKELRKREKNNAEKSQSCKENFYELEAIKFAAIEVELRQIRYLLEDACKFYKE